MPIRIRVAICDDHAIVRAGFRQFIADQADMEVTAEAETGRAALDIARSGRCDVLLLDISMPGQNGVDTLRAIKAGQPELPVLILSGYPEENYALSLMKMGASGYLRKDVDPDEVLRAIRLVAQGRRYVSQAVGEMLAAGIDDPDAAPPHTRLSDREQQVFLRLARGETVTGIAEALNLSVKTVSTYRARLFEKLSLQSNSELTYYAMKQGLIE
ncbi:response regulator [Derxia lacustris]|uniref:response regulator n=1 Tax=Derxia lacustris TaxID=764842 RepID=UPI000A171794|nr:response regulator transcription factor [Derxia lacustris]